MFYKNFACVKQKHSVRNVDVLAAELTTGEIAISFMYAFLSIPIYPKIHILVDEIAFRRTLEYFKRIRLFNKENTATTSRGFDFYLARTRKYCTNARDDGKAVKCDGE